MEEERRYEDLVRMVKNRAQQRVEKMGQLQSLLLLNGSFEDTSVPETGVSHFLPLHCFLFIFNSNGLVQDEAFDADFFSKPFVRIPREKNVPASRGSTSDTTNMIDRDAPELNKEQVRGYWSYRAYLRFGRYAYHALLLL